VTITGRGWQPGETVTLSFRESPNIDTPGPYTTVADANGNISDAEFAPDTNDLNVRFYLTAVGSNSGIQAQHTFTDSVPTTTTLSCAPSTLQVGQATTCTANTSAGSANVAGSISFSVNPSSAGTFSTISCANLPLKSVTCSLTYTPAALGSQTITAQFSGNPGKDPSASSFDSWTITVTAALILDPPTPRPWRMGLQHR
jgi:hypothetical protein